MVAHELTIRDDPRLGRVSTLIHALGQRAAFLTTDQQRFEDVADALAGVLEFDRLTVAVIPGAGEPAVPLFRRGGPVADDGSGSALTPRTSPASLSSDSRDASTNAVLENYATHKEGFRQVVTCPVVSGGRQCGLLELASRDERRFSENDLWIVETIVHASTLAQTLAGRTSGSEPPERPADDELIGELVDLLGSGPTSAAVMEHMAKRVATTGNCDVLLMFRRDDVWIGGEPVARDASRLRDRRLLLDRLRNIQPPVQKPMRPAERARTGQSETAELADLVSRLRDLLEQLPELLTEQPLGREELSRSLIVSLPPALGGPLVLVALSTDPGDQDFREEDRFAIWRIVRALSPALLSATLTESLNRASAERDAILRMVRAIRAGRTTLDRIKVACRTVQLLLACDYVAITDWTSDPPIVRFEVGRTAPAPVALSRKGTISDVRRHDEPRIITDFPKVPPLKVASYPLHIAEALSASLTFRLQWSGRTFGSLILGYRRPRHFPATDLRFAESMAHVVVASLGPELSRPEDA